MSDLETSRRRFPKAAGLAVAAPYFWSGRRVMTDFANDKISIAPR